MTGPGAEDELGQFPSGGYDYEEERARKEEEERRERAEGLQELIRQIRRAPNLDRIAWLLADRQVPPEWVYLLAQGLDAGRREVFLRVVEKPDISLAKLDEFALVAIRDGVEAARAHINQYLESRRGGW